MVAPEKNLGLSGNFGYLVNLVTFLVTKRSLIVGSVLRIQLIKQPRLFLKPDHKIAAAISGCVLEDCK